MSWPLVQISEIAIHIRNGLSIKQDDSKQGLPITRIETIANREVNLERCGYAGLNDADHKGYLLESGDILISHINSEKHLGKSAIFELEGCKLVHGMNLLCLRPNVDKIHPKYLFYCISDVVFLKQILKITKKSVNQASFTVVAFKELEIPLPPLAEQKRIAAILDKADAIRRKRQQAIKLADEFLRSVFLDMFGDPVTNPKGWDVRELQKGINSIKSGWSANGADYPCSNGQLGVLRISAVTSGIFKKSENKFVTSEDIPEGKQLLFPKKGDLLFSRANTRELVAATCIVPQDEIDVFLPDKLWIIETNKEQFLPEFLHYMIQNPKFKDVLTSQATGTSGSMLNISMAKFKVTESIYPDITLQEKFKSIFWRVQDMLNNIKTSESFSSCNFKSLSQIAFSGNI